MSTLRSVRMCGVADAPAAVGVLEGMCARRSPAVVRLVAALLGGFGGEASDGSHGDLRGGRRRAPAAPVPSSFLAEFFAPHSAPSIVSADSSSLSRSALSSWKHSLSSTEVREAKRGILISLNAALNVSQESEYQALSSSGVPNPAVRRMLLIVLTARAPNGCSAKGCNCARWNRCAGIAVPGEDEESVDMRGRLEYGSV